MVGLHVWAGPFSFCGGKKWMTRLGRKGISRTGSGAPTASGLKKSRGLRTSQGYVEEVALPNFDAILFDAGGIFLLPDPTVLGPLLRPHCPHTCLAELTMIHGADSALTLNWCGPLGILTRTTCDSL